MSYCRAGLVLPGMLGLALLSCGPPARESARVVYLADLVDVATDAPEAPADAGMAWNLPGAEGRVVLADARVPSATVAGAIPVDTDAAAIVIRGLGLPSTGIAAVEVLARLSAGSKIRALLFSESSPEPVLYTASATPSVDFRRYVLEPATSGQQQLAAGPAMLHLQPSDVGRSRYELAWVRMRAVGTNIGGRGEGRRWARLRAISRRGIAQAAGTAQTLRFVVPEAAEFEVHVGAESGVPLRYVATVSDNGAEHEILAVDGHTEWTRAVADLRPFAGSEVELTLRVEGAAGVVGFWGEPIVSPRGQPRSPAEPSPALRELAGAATPHHVILVIADRLIENEATHALLETAGTAFEDAVFASPRRQLNVPSLLTAVRPARHGIGFRRDEIPENATTLAAAMRSGGFRTRMIVTDPAAGVAETVRSGFDQIHKSAGVLDALALARQLLESPSAPRTFLTLFLPRPVQESEETPFLPGVAALLERAPGNLLVFADGRGTHPRPTLGPAREYRVSSSLVFVWPGVVGADKEIHRSVSTVDIAPTMADLASVPWPHDTDGQSLVAHLARPIAPSTLGYVSRPVFAEAAWGWPYEATARPGVSMMVEDGWQLIRLAAPFGQGTRYELYDHVRDPGARREVSARHPRLLTRMTRALDEWATGASSARTIARPAGPKRDSSTAGLTPPAPGSGPR